MHIPYVIDNQSQRLAEVLCELLGGHSGKALDIATAYFNVQGFTLLQEGLQGLGSFRLLLGDEPQDGESVGLRPRAASRLIQDLNAAPYDEATLSAVEDLIAFLRREMVGVRAYQQGFLHAKSYTFYGDLPVGGADRFQPIAAIVGSSNFTRAGLTTNRELNLSHKTVLTDDEMVRISPPPVDGQEEMELRRKLMSGVGAQAITELDRWYQERWGESRDFKDELIELLDASKFGQMEYTPYQVYMKALFEYFKDDLGSPENCARQVGLGAVRVPGGCRKEGPPGSGPLRRRSDWRLGGAGQDLDWEEALGGLRLPPAAEGAGHLSRLPASDVD